MLASSKFSDEFHVAFVLDADSQMTAVSQRYEKTLWSAPQIEIFSFHIFSIKNNCFFLNG